MSLLFFLSSPSSANVPLEHLKSNLYHLPYAPLSHPPPPRALHSLRDSRATILRSSARLRRRLHPREQIRLQHHEHSWRRCRLRRDECRSHHSSDERLQHP